MSKNVTQHMRKAKAHKAEDKEAVATLVFNKGYALVPAPTKLSDKSARRRMLSSLLAEGPC